MGEFMRQDLLVSAHRLFRIKYEKNFPSEKNDAGRKNDQPRMTHLLVRRAPDVADAIPARSTSCRVPLFVSYAQLPAVQELSHSRFRSDRDACRHCHHRAT